MDDCPFCRTPIQEDDDAALALVQMRVGAKDPVAIQFLGSQYYHGKCGLERNVPRAIELWTEAAELGSTEAQFILGNKYNEGEGVIGYSEGSSTLGKGCLPRARQKQAQSRLHRDQEWELRACS